MSAILLAVAVQVALAGVATVVDGDTLHVGGQRVRLFGIDAPELWQSCDAGAFKVACGQLAARWLRSRAQGRIIRCTQVDTDRYGRVVARCAVGGADVGREMVEAGWATAYRRYSADYVSVERRARAAGNGIWALGFVPPDAYRRARREVSAPHDARCEVKGNVSSKGDHIYHLPGSRDYAAVRNSAA